MAYLAEGEIGKERGHQGRGLTDRGAIARLDDIVVRYAGLDRPALIIDNLALFQGERVAVIGPSGGGKTTLLRLLNGTLRPAEGSIEILGRQLAGSGRQPREWRRRTGMIYQNFALVERATVIRNVLAGRLGFTNRWISLLGRFSDEDRRLALEAVSEVGLLDRAQVRVDKLSGGQRQRVAIARVLAQAPDLILADEPVSNLDPALTLDMIDLLTTACARRGAALVMAIHQPELAKSSMDRIIAVRDGEIVFDADAQALTEQALARIYGNSQQDIERIAGHRTHL